MNGGDRKQGLDVMKVRRGLRTGKKPARETPGSTREKNWKDLETEDAGGRGGRGRKKAAREKQSTRTGADAEKAGVK